MADGVGQSQNIVFGPRVFRDSDDVAKQGGHVFLIQQW